MKQKVMITLAFASVLVIVLSFLPSRLFSGTACSCYSKEMVKLACATKNEYSSHTTKGECEYNICKLTHTVTCKDLSDNGTTYTQTISTSDNCSTCTTGSGDGGDGTGNDTGEFDPGGDGTPWENPFQ